MKVRATKLGFYIGRRRPGDVFEVPDDFKASWVEPVDEVKEQKVKSQKPKTMTLAEGGKTVGADKGEVDLA